MTVIHKVGTPPHLAVDTIGQFLAITVTPANGTQSDALTEAIQAATGDAVKVVFVDWGYPDTHREACRCRCRDTGRRVYGVGLGTSSVLTRPI